MVYDPPRVDDIKGVRSIIKILCITDLQVRAQAQRRESLSSSFYGTRRQIKPAEDSSGSRKLLVIGSETDADLQHPLLARSVKRGETWNVGLKLVPNSCLLGERERVPAIQVEHFST